VGREK
jgi:plastocyanin